MLTIVEVRAHVNILSHFRFYQKLVGIEFFFGEVELGKVGQVLIPDIWVILSRLEARLVVLSINEPEAVVSLDISSLFSIVVIPSNVIITPGSFVLLPTSPRITDLNQLGAIVELDSLLDREGVPVGDSNVIRIFVR